MVDDDGGKPEPSSQEGCDDRRDSDVNRSRQA